MSPSSRPAASWPAAAFGLVVAAEDPFGNVDPNFSGSVTVALSNNPGGATLGGTLTVTAQNGVATFSGLTLNQPGIGYTLSGLQQRPDHGDHQPLQRLIAAVHLARQQPGRSGTGSGNAGDLRYVITQADQTPGDNTINFAVTGTITLNSALPDLSNTTGLMDIEGPGREPDRGPAHAVEDACFRHLHVDAGARSTSLA